MAVIPPIKSPVAEVSEVDTAKDFYKLFPQLARQAKYPHDVVEITQVTPNIPVNLQLDAQSDPLGVDVLFG